MGADLSRILMLLFMIMTASAAVAADRTDGMLPDNHRLFFTPEQRRSSSGSVHVDGAAQTASESTVNSMSDVSAQMAKASAHRKPDRDDGLPAIRFNALVKGSTTYHLLINNLPCQTYKPEATSTATATPALLLDCPHLDVAPLHLKFQSRAQTLFVYRHDKLLQKLEVGQNL